MTSGLVHGQRCATVRIARGGRPSWAATAARSAFETSGSALTRRSLAGLLHARPQPGRPGIAAGGVLAVRERLLDVGLRAAVDDHVHRVAGHRVLQPLAGLLLDEPGIGPLLVLLLQLGELLLVALQLVARGIEVAAAAEVAVQRRGQ